MKRSHAQTGVLLAAGLGMALIVHFWPTSGSTEAIPAISQPPRPSMSTTRAPSSGATVSADPNGSASESYSPPPVASWPTVVDSTVDPEPPMEPEVLPAVSGLEVSRNNARSVLVRWDEVPSATRYAVYSNGAIISRVAETRAVFIWETDALRIGIAAETPHGLGPVSTVQVERPAEPAPATSAPAPTPEPTVAPPAPAPDPVTTPSSPQPEPEPSTPEPTPEPPPSEPEPPGNPTPPSEKPKDEMNGSEA